MGSAATSVLRHGEFLGDFAGRRESPGFSFAELVPIIPSAQVARHSHADAHFVLLLVGHYISTAAGAGPVAKPPLLIYNPPGTTHRDRFHSLHGRFFTISVPAATLSHVTGVVSLLERPTAFSAGNPVALATRLSLEFRDWAPASPLIAEGLCLELMAGMARDPGPNHRHPPSWLKTARELLHDRCSDDITIAAIAHTVGVHPIHLARTFREFFHCTPGDYLRNCRLERATVLLANNNLSIAAIAAQTGFADQSHFSKAFRKAFSLSPGQYRRAHVSK